MIRSTSDVLGIPGTTQCIDLAREPTPRLTRMPQPHIPQEDAPDFALDLDRGMRRRSRLYQLLLDPEVHLGVVHVVVVGRESMRAWPDLCRGFSSRRSGLMGSTHL